ncbi:hypothetical protein [[Mycoplasma] anseris]|uniref:Uncharacterized protein n=1 Tax=[Mycoplasma] anseris TaxID=92400 RepID=A0A2Z4NDM4_9BACT|nr:hypothetical protein [[Mycoplasma] anseris]AWX69692.1 hypothetical protein DP065_02975 [[Mycoplasma] anseris]
MSISVYMYLNEIVEIEFKDGEKYKGLLVQDPHKKEYFYLIDMKSEFRIKFNTLAIRKIQTSFMENFCRWIDKVINNKKTKENNGN